MHVRVWPVGLGVLVLPRRALAGGRRDILRLPLRSEAQAASSKLSGEAWSATRLHGTLTEFRSRAQTTLISLETIEAVSTSEWLPDQTSPVGTLMVSLSMPQNDAFAPEIRAKQAEVVAEGAEVAGGAEPIAS